MKPLIAIALLLVALPAAAEMIQLDAASQTRVGLEVRPVTERSFGDQLRVVGQVVRSPGAEVTVKSAIDGRVVTLHVAPGDTVREGQPLLELHSHTLHQLQGELLRTHEAQRLAETRLAAGRQLYDLEGISRIELEEREQQALAARLEARSVEGELEHLGYTEEEIAELVSSAETHPLLKVRAPAAGAVLELMVQRHAWVQPYEALLVLGDPGAVELQLQLPPDEAASVHAGDRVEFVPVGRPEMMGRARVVTRVPQVDRMTRTVTIRAAIEEGGDALLPGVFVEGTLARGEASASPAVPESAVARIGTSDFLFVRRGPESFEARPVTLGRFQGSSYEVVEGVAVGEEVAVEGVFLLKSTLVRGSEEEGG